MRRLALMLAMIVGWAMFGAVPARGQVDGPQLSDTEQQATMQTFQYALENNKTDQAAAWVNPDTDTSGSLVPVRTYQNEQGQYCREYVTTITIAGQEEQGYGTACRQADGTWVIVSGESPAEGGPPAEEQTVVQSVEPAYPVSPRPTSIPTVTPTGISTIPIMCGAPTIPASSSASTSSISEATTTTTTTTTPTPAGIMPTAGITSSMQHASTRGDIPTTPIPAGDSRITQPGRVRAPAAGTSSVSARGPTAPGAFIERGNPQAWGTSTARGILGTVRHYEGTRRFGGRHSTGTIHRSTTVHSFRGRMNVREHRGLGAFPSFRGRMGGTHHGSNGYHGGGYSGGKFRSGGHR